MVPEVNVYQCVRFGWRKVVGLLLFQQWNTEYNHSMS